MLNTFVSIPCSVKSYYKLPAGIESLTDDKVEWWNWDELSCELKLKLKNKNKVYEIKSCGENFLKQDNRKKMTYHKKDIPFFPDYRDSDDESDSDED